MYNFIHTSCLLTHAVHTKHTAVHTKHILHIIYTAYSSTAVYQLRTSYIYTPEYIRYVDLYHIIRAVLRNILPRHTYEVNDSTKSCQLYVLHWYCCTNYSSSSNLELRRYRCTSKYKYYTYAATVDCCVYDTIECRIRLYHNPWSRLREEKQEQKTSPTNCQVIFYILCFQLMLVPRAPQKKQKKPLQVRKQEILCTYTYIYSIYKNPSDGMVHRRHKRVASHACHTNNASTAVAYSWYHHTQTNSSNMIRCVHSTHAAAGARLSPSILQTVVRLFVSHQPPLV